MRYFSHTCLTENTWSIHPLPCLNPHCSSPIAHSVLALNLLISTLPNSLQSKNKYFLVQVWTLPKVWEGFVKCCERAVPHCCVVLLELPLDHLSTALQSSSVLKSALTQHISALTDSQVTSNQIRGLTFGIGTNLYIIKDML